MIELWLQSVASSIKPIRLRILRLLQDLFCLPAKLTLVVCIKTLDTTSMSELKRELTQVQEPAKMINPTTLNRIPTTWPKRMIGRLLALR